MTPPGFQTTATDRSTTRQRLRALAHQGGPRFDTADFADTAPGNLHADYVLPRAGTKVVRSGVFWPVGADPLFRPTGVFDPQWSAVNGFPTSDHRLVWADLVLPRH
jgi:hypothetical protein